MRLLLRLALLVVLFALPVASITTAATLNLTGSIGSSIASGNNGSVTYSGNSDFGRVTFTANPRGSDLTWSAGNGLGINCPSNISGCREDTPYQIDTPEFLTVGFADRLFLTSVDIGLLTTTPGTRYTLRCDEEGSIVGSGFRIEFDSDDAVNGILTVAVNRWVRSVNLIPNRGEWNDFSLARLRIDENRGNTPPSQPIPEPSSVLLMLIGGGIVASQVRKHV